MWWRTRPLALAAGLTLLGAGVALAAQPEPGAHYAGKTRQHHDISFDVSANTKRLTHPHFYLQTRCNGGGRSFAQTSAHTTARASGRIRRGRFRFHFSETARVSHGVKATANFFLDGRFASPTRAVGEVSVKVRYSNGAECDSGAVRYSART